jgi:exopolysaccharide biosynthesis predicted pyruvyltransferase EpsI
MALKFGAEPPAVRAPWFNDDIAASCDKLLRAIGETNDLTFIRGYGNIGDRLIYAGTRQLLTGLQWRELSIQQLDGVCGHTAVVSGSGAWCRPYHDMPQYLPQIEAQFRRVVILPSSFDVSEDSVRAALAETKALVFARERESYRQIRDLCHADLAHDCAFFFDYESFRRPGEGRLCAYRTDWEAAGQPLPEDNRDLSVTCEGLDEWLWTIARHAEVYTDRAHVMIAAAMLGKRVVYSASSYHKVPAIAEYALANFPVRRAAPPAQHDKNEGR